MEVKWISINDRAPNHSDVIGGIEPPFIPCIVFACYPGKPIGGVIETCRWDVEKNEWLRSDVAGNWMLAEPYEITHFIANMPNPD